MNYIVLIPAYKVGSEFPGIVRDLCARGVERIIVVDDGSGPEYHHIFDAVAALPGVRLLRHAINMGKGAALKTGINAVLCDYPDVQTVVTVDADGQHHPDDVLAVAKQGELHPDCLVIGARAFDKDVPLRSAFGNRLTRLMMRAVMGQNIQDTQSGLRAIPRAMMPSLLAISANRYEFELDMLVRCKSTRTKIVEQPIRTIYIDDNRASHFNPLLDSMRIYFIFVRYVIVSIATALIDNAVFAICALFGLNTAASQTVSRLTAMMFNYFAVKKNVFSSQQEHRAVFIKYALLVLVSGVLSYALILLLLSLFPISVITAKVCAEAVLFIFNFVVQRDLIFVAQQEAPQTTDWDAYYRNAFFMSRYTRQYTGAVLSRNISKYAHGASNEGVVFAELGGANSIFFNMIRDTFKIKEYHVVDTNQFGLDLMRQREPDDATLRLHQASVLELDAPIRADIVMSVGLIEHFDCEATRKAVESHFAVLKPGGTAIITFPTPTLLYQVARSIVEMMGLWKFHDERPLGAKEVRAAIEPYGEVLHEEILWPLVFTQRLMVVRRS